MHSVVEQSGNFGHIYVSCNIVGKNLIGITTGSKVIKNRNKRGEGGATLGSMCWIVSRIRPNPNFGWNFADFSMNSTETETEFQNSESTDFLNSGLAIKKRVKKL
jgi:imidazoleglycerol phosphate synthase glutamine amidotransferase subunit HisH